MSTVLFVEKNAERGTEQVRLQEGRTERVKKTEGRIYAREGSIQLPFGAAPT